MFIKIMSIIKKKNKNKKQKKSVGYFCLFVFVFSIGRRISIFSKKCFLFFFFAMRSCFDDYYMILVRNLHLQMLYIQIDIFYILIFFIRYIFLYKMFYIFYILYSHISFFLSHEMTLIQSFCHQLLFHIYLLFFKGMIITLD